MTNPTCIVEGCESATRHRGMCSKHHTRWLRHGTTDYVGRKPTPKRTCGIDGCERGAKYREWCTLHYDRWRKHGDPMGGGRRYSSPEESFAARTERRGDCLIWTGTLDHSGYGTIAVPGGKMPAHRWIYQRHHGPLPTESRVDHICHNPSCVEVSHLREVTQKQNGENRKSANSNNRTSQYLGVSFDKGTGRWSAAVTHNQKSYWGGRHDTEDQAAEAAATLRNQLFTHNDHDRPGPHEDAGHTGNLMKGVRHGAAV